MARSALVDVTKTQRQQHLLRIIFLVFIIRIISFVLVRNYFVIPKFVSKSRIEKTCTSYSISKTVKRMWNALTVRIGTVYRHFCHVIGMNDHPDFLFSIELSRCWNNFILVIIHRWMIHWVLQVTLRGSKWVIFPWSETKYLTVSCSQKGKYIRNKIQIIKVTRKRLNPRFLKTWD